MDSHTATKLDLGRQLMEKKVEVRSNSPLCLDRQRAQRDSGRAVQEGQRAAAALLAKSRHEI